MIWYLLLFFFLLAGQVLRFEISGVAIMGLDIAVFFLILSSVFDLKKDKIAFPLVLFLLSGLVSLLITSLSLSFNQTLISSLYLVRLTIYLGLFFVTRSYLIQEKITKKFVTLSLLVVGAGIAVLGFFQMLLYPDIRNLYYLGWDPHYGRLVSSTFDPNFTGIILVITFLLCLNEFLSKPIKKNVPLFLFIMFIFSALVFTYSRSSYLALSIGLFVWGIIHKKIKYFLIFGVLLITAVYFVPKPPGEGGKLTRTSTSSARIINWQESFTLWQKSPLIGFGFNALSFVKEKYGLLPENEKNIPNHARSGVDNSLLFVLLTTGLIGFAFFLWVLVEVYKKVSSGKKIYLPIFTAVLFHSFFQNTLFFPQVLVYLMLLLAITTWDDK